jgi:hypothetical protein
VGASGGNKRLSLLTQVDDVYGGKRINDYRSDCLSVADGFVSRIRTGTRMITGTVIDQAATSVIPETHAPVQPVAFSCALKEAASVCETPTFRFSAVPSIRHLSSYARDHHTSFRVSYTGTLIQEQLDH